MAKNFLKYVIVLLGTLDLSMIVAGIYFLFRQEWMVGITLIVVSCFTLRNTFELKHANASFSETNDRINEAGANAILRALRQSGALLILPAVVLFLHFGLRWQFAIPLGLITGPAIAFSLGSISAALSNHNVPVRGTRIDTKTKP